MAVKHEWRPEAPCGYAPLFVPSQWGLKNFANYFFGYPGFIWPWNTIYFLMCCITYKFATPPSEMCKEFGTDWVARLWFRNLILLWMFAGGWHLLLYTMKSQGPDGMDRKYDKTWPAYNKKFLFGHQTYENVFMSCASGVTIWTAYEALFMRMWANDSIPFYTDWFHNPEFVPTWIPRGGWSFFVLFCIPFWREFHFYWIHRFSHWKPFYKQVHYLHHKNVNPGPWSGLSMHPVEHIMYFAVVFPHMFIVGHPIHLFFNAQHTALTPAGGHHGFEGPVKGPGPAKYTGSYFHYLHHRYFECNYGEATLPLDKWFGTFRDGQSVADGKMSSTPGGSKEPAWVTVLTAAVGTAIGLVPVVSVLQTGLK